MEPSIVSLVCSDCRERKPASQFPRNKRSSSGYHCYCKSCHNSRNRRFVKSRYGDSRHYHLRGRYGLGSEEVQALIRTQNGLCAVCLERGATQVDHCHETGSVRGVLCLLCNAAMGAFHDDPDLIRAAISYLEEAR
ncbi:MAG: endonuclease VII domain-containing protein [Actinomycetota bacterium]